MALEKNCFATMFQQSIDVFDAEVVSFLDEYDITSGVHFYQSF